MIDVPHETKGEEHQTDLDPEDAAGPVGRVRGAVAGEPAADAGGVEGLEGEGGEPDGGVDGGHAGVEEEGGKEGAVEVVDCLVRKGRG